MGTERGKHTQKLGFKGGIKECHQKQNIYSNLLTIKLGMIQYKYQVNLAKL